MCHIVVITGDGATFANVPGAPRQLSLCFIRPLVFKSEVRQCCQSAKVVLVSTLSETNPQLRRIIDDMRDGFPSTGRVYIPIDDGDVDFIVKYKVFGCGDWKWVQSVFNYSVAAGGKYAVTEVVAWKHKKCVGISDDKLMGALINYQDIKHFDQFSFEDLKMVMYHHVLQ